MILFLTSSPSGPLDKPNYERKLDSSNFFLFNLKKYWKKDMKGLIICAFSESYESNDEMREFFYDAFKNSGIPTSFDLWDKRIEDVDIQQYDFIMLAGGHVPTENEYFKEIHLKEKIKDYDGIVMGVSAGSMNCASIVYAQPELENESIDPNYHRFIEGLGICEINVLPHYQMVKDFMLDNQRLFEDITYKDSMNHSFYALNDGSYILIDEYGISLYGEAYLIKDGIKNQICEQNNIIRLNINL